MTNYDAFADTFSNSRKNLKWPEIDYFQKYLQDLPKKSVLDVGCGSGRLINHLGIENGEYMGIDNSAKMIENAKKDHPNQYFQVSEMGNFSLEKKYDYVFFIASFHHLKDVDSRIECLKNLKKYIKSDTIVFMTNWKLDSEIYKDKYSTGIIQSSENEFGSLDFEVKIGDFNRFYHCFSEAELEFLFEKTGFEIVENRLFDNQKNIISVIKLKK